MKDDWCTKRPEKEKLKHHGNVQLVQYAHDLTKEKKAICVMKIDFKSKATVRLAKCFDPTSVLQSTVCVELCTKSGPTKFFKGFVNALNVKI